MKIKHSWISCKNYILKTNKELFSKIFKLIFDLKNGVIFKSKLHSNCYTLLIEITFKNFRMEYEFFIYKDSTNLYYDFYKIIN